MSNKISIDRINNRIKKIMSRNDVVEYQLIELLNKQIQIRDAHIIHLTNELHRLKYKCPIEDRKLNEEVISSSQTKLTINPVTGRVSLKYSKMASDVVRKEILDFVKDTIMLHDFPPLTFRGAFHFVRSDRSYRICMQSESKISVRFTFFSRN